MAIKVDEAGERSGAGAREGVGLCACEDIKGRCR